MLKDVMFQIRGLSYSKKDSTDEYSQDYIPVLRAGNIQESKILEEDYVYVPKRIVKPKQLLKKGDVLIAASSGSISIVGKAAMVSQDMNASFGAFCKVLRPDISKIDLSYFKHYFETEYYKRTIKGLAEGANINNLKSEHFDNLDIPLPPLPIQKKIAAILDAADAYRQKTKALIAKYDELTQSLFLDMFGDPVTNPKGWEKYKGEDVCVKISVGVVIKPASYYVDKGVIALRSLNVKPFKIDLSDVVYFSQETHKNELKKSILKDGDVVVVRTGNTGTAALITKELDGINCIDLIIVRVDKSKLNANYLCHFLNSERGKELVAGKSVGGIHKHFNVGAMKGTNIPLPHIDLQRLFEKRVEILKSQQTKAQASLDKAEDLFNSLLQKAFNGEL